MTRFELFYSFGLARYDYSVTQDDYRLPEGMKRVGYDADSGKYFFRDDEGHTWEGQEGAHFGEMTRGTHAPFDFFQMTLADFNIQLQSRMVLRSPTVTRMTWRMVLGVRMAMRPSRVMR
jgi:hypothetical protein